MQMEINYDIYDADPDTGYPRTMDVISLYNNGEKVEPPIDILSDLERVLIQMVPNGRYRAPHDREFFGGVK